MIQLIKDIPTDGRQDYDVLGFIYEYLISNFAANAGKKAGEFYTPHEVSQLKYAVTYLELDEQIQKSEQVLSSMIDELTGNEYDMKGLAEFKALLKGDANA